MRPVSSSHAEAVWPTATSGLQDRFKKLDQESLCALYNSDGLIDFLPKAIAFLRVTDNERFNECIAGYLMGKYDFLPNGLNDQKTEISREVRRILYDLLRTNRYGIFGRGEDAEKTIKKLNALYQELVTKIDSDLHFVQGENHDYQSELNEWVNAAPEDELVDRQIAAQALLAAIKKTAEDKIVTLANLRLTKIPPLPPDLRELDLANNRLTSLAGMPAQMIALKKLDLDHNQLTSLAGMPEQMDALKYLSLGYNQLTSLAGMPAQMIALKKLDLGRNQLTSLAGMPAQMDALKYLSLGYNQLTSLAGMPARMDALGDLSLEHNELTSLAGMPEQMDALEYLFLEHNELTSLAGMSTQIAQRNIYINLELNPLTQGTIAAINNHTYQARIDFDMAAYETGSRDVKSLDQEVKAWFVDEDTSRWEQYAESDGGKALANLLMRLHGCASFKGEGKTTSKKELREILARVLSDGAFRAHCFFVTQGSDADCHDNVQSIFDELRMQLGNPATKDGATVTDVVKFQRGSLAVKLIDEYVGTLSGGDPLESGMLLKQQLSQTLSLPIQFGEIKYAASGVVFNDIESHKTKAVEYVESRQTLQRVSEEMADDVTCTDFLKKSYRAMFTAHHLLWLDALDKSTNNTSSNVVDEKESPLHAAQKMQLGDGKKFTVLKEGAEKVLLKYVASHAQLSSAMNSQERTAWEIKELTKDRDWLDYLTSLEKNSTEMAQPNTDVQAKTRVVLWTEAGITV